MRTWSPGARGLQSCWDESGDLSKCTFYYTCQQAAEQASVQINSGQSSKELKVETFMERKRKGLSEGVKKQWSEAQNHVSTGTVGSLPGTAR